LDNCCFKFAFKKNSECSSAVFNFTIQGCQISHQIPLRKALHRKEDKEKEWCFPCSGVSQNFTSNRQSVFKAWSMALLCWVIQTGTAAISSPQKLSTNQESSGHAAKLQAEKCIDSALQGWFG